jgi:hypothetical protein
MALVESRRNTPFKWGEHDCALFACDAVVEITGFDPGKPFRGAYSTAIGAARVLKSFAGGGLREAVELIAVEIGAQKVSPLFARRGDIGLINDESEHGFAMAVCVGLSWAAPGKNGLKMRAVDNVIYAWRVE